MAKMVEEQEKARTKARMSGSLMLIEALKEEKVEVIFGYPGGRCSRCMTSCIKPACSTC